MKKLLSTLSSTLQEGVRGGILLLALIVSTSAIYASDTQVDGIWYDFDSSTKTASVTYLGSDPSCYEGRYSGSVIIPETVTYNGTTYSVTSIGGCAFQGCSSLTSMTIPESVTSIGGRAFQGCSSLTSMTIPESVTSIGNAAFFDCSSLTSVTIPNSVTSIGSAAFQHCHSLTSPVYNAHCFAYMPTSFKGAYVIPEGIKQIAGGAFSSCTSLTSMTIPNSVTSIGDEAFYYCRSLTSINIPNSVTSIGDRAFVNCSSLTSVTIPNSVTSIGESAFCGCSSLTSMTIPESVTSIGESAFYGCSSLTSVTIPNSVTSIGSAAFQYCRSLTSITIPESVTSIGEMAFFDCSSLTSVTIPNSVTSIGSAAFQYCRSLTSITIPNSVTSIGHAAFCGCSGLTSVTIPNSVTSIGNYAFEDCSSLTSVTIGEGVTSIGEGAFSGCSALTSITWEAENVFEYSEVSDVPFYDIRSQITEFVFGNKVQCIPAYFCYEMEKLTSVTIPNSVKTIGTSAFEGCIRLGKLSLGAAIENIAATAFAGCNRLYHIYCYPTYPPFADQSSFANYNVYLHVPCDYKEGYDLDVVWGKFNFIECLESEETTTDGNVTVVPGTNDVTITWPTEGNADTYTIVIKKGNEVFCTLTFNAEGQLLNIAFAPSRDGKNHPAQYAVQTVSGYRFTVTGLEEGTHYTYNIDVRDIANKTINSHAGEFTTMGGTAVEDILQNTTNIQKLLRNGQLIILRDGKTYTTMGAEIQ